MFTQERSVLSTSYFSPSRESSSAAGRGVRSRPLVDPVTPPSSDFHAPDGECAARASSPLITELRHDRHPEDEPPDPARRRLLAGIAASTAGATLAACGGGGGLPRSGATASAVATTTPDSPDNGASGSTSPGSPSTGSGSSGGGTTMPTSGGGTTKPSSGGTATPTSTSSGGMAMPTTTGGGVTSMPMPTETALPAPADTGIDHIVVLMMENRSFDHMYGWLPGAVSSQAGTFKDTSGASFETHHLTSYQSCGSADPDHSYEGGRTHLNNGQDGRFSADQPGRRRFPDRLLHRRRRAVHEAVRRQLQRCSDQYYSGILSATYPNRIYMHTGQTDRLSNTSTSSTLPAIWDMLAAKNLTGTYYFNDLPLTSLFGSRFLSISQPFTKFLADAKAGTLPSLSYVDPYFGGEGNGVSKDDHPLADVRDGQAYMAQIYSALSTGANWSKTLFIINYDEWGGFHEHVVPPFAPVSAAESTLGNDGRLGFRVPCMLIGPRAKKGFIEKRQWDPNSILNFICWRFGLDTLGVRASTSGNIAHALDFVNPPRTDVPAFTVAAGPFGVECDVQTHLPAGVALTDLTPGDRSKAEHLLELDSLRVLSRRYGFTWPTAR